MSDYSGGPGNSARSRTLIWLLAAILGIVLVATAVVFAFVLADSSDAEPSAASTTTLPPPVTETVTQQAPVPQPIVPTVAEPTVEEPAAPQAAVGTTCDTPGYVGFDASGTELVCQYMGAGGGYKWVNIVPSSGPGELGGPCDPATQATARTSDGRALLCSPGPNGEPGIWMDGP
ncbi:hypothetical protein [Williamsia sp. 1135]|uniref:hypothetical protein n=1 Tax=Williamsia sp. 1135 TaxID=1889262 RepID=UPI00117FA700|nr:hypothetical protein [Williamsia sp. 1135]